MAVENLFVARRNCSRPPGPISSAPGLTGVGSGSSLVRLFSFGLIIQNKIEIDRQFAPLNFCSRFAQRNAILSSASVNLRRAGGQRLQQSKIRVVNVLAPKNENHFVDFVLGREEISGGFYSDLRCFWNRIAICAATDRRKSNRLDSIFNRELQRAAITICQDLRLVAFSSSPNRADCVNDKTRWQTISARDFRLAGSTTAECPAFCK